MSPQLRWSNVCIGDFVQSLLFNNPSPHRCPLWLFFRLCLKGGSCSGHGWIVSPKIAYERCCAENEGPCSPPSRPHCPESLGLSDSLENTKPRSTGHICALCFFAPFSQLKTQFSALPVKLSRRGGVPSAENDLMQFTLCKVVFVHCTSSPFSFAPKISPLLNP